MTKIAAFVLLTFLLLAPFTTATRPGPVSHKQTQQLVTEQQEEKVRVCEGLNEEECLMRRTLIAHIDYIYTQKKQN